MYPDIETIEKILLKESYISEEDSKAAKAGAHSTVEYIDYLIREELLSRSLLGQAIAESYGVPFVDLEVNMVGKEQVNTIPENIGRTQRAIFVKASDKVAAVATDQPANVDMKQLAALFPHKTLRLAYALPEYIDLAFSQYEQPLDTRFSAIIENGQRIAPEILDEIIKDALAFKASDIHFEPDLTTISVRFRVDGSLRDAGQIPMEYYENILNRIKVESGMRIDEHFAAQDGAIQRKGDISADLRVSLVPTVRGEKVVMRVLSSYVQGFTLSDIGLDENFRKLLERYANKPFGMILTVGPTGSGKTTTLYSLLKLLNRRDVNITTIEDPVEYKIAGVNQIPVREQAGMTFAKGLRSIVRQDPDVILVGEIRDAETAEISVNAALTGHLLLSTFHANDAATAIPRLIDLGTEPFLLASTLELVIAQRLVRKLCTHCKYSLGVADALAKAGPAGEDLKGLFTVHENLYAAKGCPACNNTGYNGRSALFEFIEVTPEIGDLILKTPSTQEIAALAQRQGGRSLFDDGIAKAKSGVTTIEELLRVVEPPRVREGHGH